MENNRRLISQNDLYFSPSYRMNVDRNKSEVIRYSEVDAEISLTQRVRRNDGVYISALKFEDCVFNKPVHIGEYDSAGIVFFTNCIFKADVSFNSLSNIKLEGENKFIKNLTINYNKSDNISGFTVDGQLKINSETAFHISKINSGVVDQNLVIQGSFPMIEISACFFKSIDIIPDHRITTKINVNGVFAKKIYIGDQGPVSSCSIKESEVEEIRFKDKTSGNPKIDIRYLKKVSKITIPMSNTNKAEIAYSQIDKLLFTGKNDNKGSIEIQNCQVKNIEFNDILNEGLIAFRSVEILTGGRIIMKSSNLGKAEFINCNFNGGILEFENSRITEIFVAEADFPRRVILKEEESFSQAQLAFGQLATAYQKQGDNVRALEYQSREIEAHYRYIPWFRNRVPNLTKITLWLNKISNDFGRNWGYGVVFSFSVGILFFYFLVLSSDEYEFAFHIDYSDKMLASFLKFMNPLRFIDTESLFKINSERAAITLNGWSYLWDFVGRLFVAYGFYQTIQAFRRFGRK